MIVQTWFDECLKMLFPRRCPVCEEIVEPVGELICPSCAAKLSPVTQPTCRKCGKELVCEQEEYCFDCSRHRRSFESGVALFNYNDAARRSMAAIKYRNKREFLDFYAAAMIWRFGKVILNWNPDVLIPVPVHPSRRRKRGFNQAEDLAKRLSEKLAKKMGQERVSRGKPGLSAVPVDTGLLFRIKKTMPQRELDPRQRMENLQQAFAADTSRTMPNCVVLVDDIYTTGSTMEACARVLKAAGVAEIHFAVICIGGGR